MLNKLTITNFKRFERVAIDLANPVVFIGPNNSGKTTALQSIALWDAGLRLWLAKHGERLRKGEDLGKRPGVTVNRGDLAALPVPSAQLLWYQQHVRRGKTGPKGKGTENIRIGLEVEGTTGLNSWTCGIECDYANDESFYCRPLGHAQGQSQPIPVEIMGNLPTVAFLPPMGGIASHEDLLQKGSILTRIGQGRTAEVLRNLCYRLVSEPPLQGHWDTLVQEIERMFGIQLEAPEYNPASGGIIMTYTDHGVRYDLSCSGRGMQQATLLLSFMLGIPGSALLLDEPDAHLEILRQRQIFEVVNRIAGQTGSQVICASHSEVVLEEAAGSHTVVAFVGSPHRIDVRAQSQVVKALKDIGFSDYYLADSKRRVLYLEGSTDLKILLRLAQRLAHPVAPILEQAFVHYLSCNTPNVARDHFFGLKVACPDLRGLLILDNLPSPPSSGGGLECRMWQRKEIENYFCQPETLRVWARKVVGQVNGDGQTTIFEEPAIQAMDKAIQDNISPRALRDPNDSFWMTNKVSEDFLPTVFEAFFQILKMPNRFHKTSYAELVDFVPPQALAPELIETLDHLQMVLVPPDPSPVSNDTHHCEP